MKIRLATVVWGREYADTFLRVGLRTLLAAGNAPDLARAHRVIYTIYTTPEDARLLEAEPAFARLRAAVDVRLSLFAADEIDSDNYGSHGLLWWRAMEVARRNSEVLFFVIPDLLYGRGTLLRWARRFESGSRAIFTVGPQVALETVLPELEARFPVREEPCDLDEKQLFDVFFRHAHPLHAAMRHDSARRPPHPEYDLRIVPGQGVMIRDIVSHPFCLDPSYFSRFRHYGPEDHLDAVAFEPCSTLSVEPLLKRIDLYYRPRPLDEIRLSNLGGWWECFTTASCERESEFPFELCLRGDEQPAARASRRRAVAGGRFYRSQIVASGRLFRLFADLRTRGLNRAATLLAAAVYAGRLRRHIGFRRGATLLVPTDGALQGDWERIRELLLPGRERAFLDFICDHILLRKEELAVSRRHRQHAAQGEDLITALGLCAEPLLADINAGQPFECGPFTIYPIDRVLWREDASAVSPVAASATAVVAEPAAAPAVPPAVAAANRRDTREWMPPARPRIFVVTRWARQSPFHLILYYTLHIPFVEPLVALVFPIYFRSQIKDLLRTCRNVARAALRKDLHGLRARTGLRMPPIGRFARGLSQITRSVPRDSNSIATSVPFLRSAARLPRQLALPFRLGFRALQVVWRDGLTVSTGRALRAARRDGLTGALRMARSRLQTGFGMKHSAPVPPLRGVGVPSEGRTQRTLHWLPINALRRLALRLETVPLLGRFVHLPMKVLRGVLQDGISVTRMRIAARIPFLHSAAHLRRQLVPSFRLWRRAIQVVRRDGLTVAVRKARSRLGAVSDMKHLTPLVPPGRADVLREIRSVRALLAIEAVLADFERKLHFDGIQSAPLAFVRRKLEDLRGGLPLGRTLEARLMELTKNHRSWAEAWLELGFLYQDEDNADQALACFERAMRGSRLSDRAPRNISPQALAAANHGRLLIAEGRYQEACESFSAALTRDPDQKALAVEYANALRRLGQVDLALTYYGEGMFYQESRWNLPPLPRDASSLSFPHLVSPERLQHKRGPVVGKAHKRTLQNVGT